VVDYYEYGKELLASIKGRKSLEQLSDCGLLNKASAS
jgi:hypothetical protein